MSTQKRFWIHGCSHEGKDVPLGYRSYHRAIQDSLGPMGGWDRALDLGDHDASQGLPDAVVGTVVQSERASLTAQQLANILPCRSNHDRPGPHQNDDWFATYIDPMGENTATSGVDATLRSNPFVGTADRYYVDFENSNIRFLMISDTNRPLTAGRGVYGGDPGGAISSDTWDWFVDQVESNQDKILIVGAHYMIRETTIATGDYEGVQWDSTNKRWESWIHGCGRNPKYSSYLAYIDEIEGAPHFENYFYANPGCIAAWFGAHSHLKPGQTINGRGFVEQKWGITFVQAGALTQHHGVNSQLYPRSRLLIVEDGQQMATMRHFFHTNSDFTSKGWWPNDHTIDLGQPVQL